MASENKWKLVSLKTLFNLSILEGIVALVILFYIPPDSKNAWLLGYSKFRWTLILAMLVLIGFFSLVSLKTWLDEDWTVLLVMRIETWVNAHGSFFIILASLFVTLFLGPYIYLMFTPTVHLPIIRLAPALWWGILVSIQFITIGGFYLARAPKSEPCSIKDDIPVKINPRIIILYLGSISALLVVVSLSANLLNLYFGDPKLAHYIKRLYFNAERSIPTYFSSILLLIAALLIGSIWALRNRTGKTYTFHWGSLAFLFFLLSMDEVAGIHEMMNRPMRLMLNPTGFFAFAWVTLAIPVLIILGLFYLRFFLQLPKMLKIYIMVAAVLYIGGALGFEMITARHFELYDDENLAYLLLVTMEETLEIIGALIFVYALLQYFSDCYQGIRFRVSGSETNLGPQ